uniref:KIB1-4 beta-propeller domain-containing protein n=1 Tax=Arundo donax TaxID=35708 RepID=A0A0A9B0I0_ARUDO
MKRRRICLPSMAGGSVWSSIPGDLLEHISGHLSSDADLLHIHQVCAHWRACTSPPAACRPWIMAHSTSWSRSRAPGDPDYSLWLPRRVLQRRVEIGGPPPAGLRYCCGASRGWLALVDGAPTRLVLWEPASGAEVPLPCLSPVARVFLSGDPLASAGWMAIASQSIGGHAHRPFFWRPGDAAWSSLREQPIAGIVSVAFHGERVYYLEARRVVVAYDLNLGTARPPAFVGIRNVGWLVNRLCRCERLIHVVRGAHLVTCAGELLLVVLRRGPALRRGGRPPRSSCGPSFCSSFAEVYRPEWRSQGTLELGERVTDLGENSLFLGGGESFALSAKEFPAIKRNHVYCVAPDWNYSLKGDRTLPGWAFVFDLGSDTLKEIPYPKDLRDDGTNWWPYSWFCLRSPLMKKQQQ